ncbi:hypothetical protein FA95DRAFT_1549574 [Auriscalpium vulgare]|uniref:Uncharacterized protein n=1 Tax=Auriscalpium vulgare TaxID=40419 RepID=A0ACB8R9T1_9AGAM|nr:hypothetical protein FA95DRAFT_1549574 [Auriscalpium vulgare]
MAAEPAAPSDGQEIIDLTNSPKREIIEIHDTPPPTPSKAPELPRENRRERRKRMAEELGSPNGKPTQISTRVSKDSSVKREAKDAARAADAGAEDGERTGNGDERKAKKKRRRGNKRDDEASSQDVNKEPVADDSLFVVDTEPVQVPTNLAFQITITAVAAASNAAAGPSSSTTADASPALLLPSHVSVLEAGDGITPIQIIRPPESDSDSDSYIEYLDYDDRNAAGVVRYFDDRPNEEKHARFVCKRCGVENEHKTYECPVQICLTCGARDEHSTRGCPISKKCFNCGMRGHINKTCPNRHSRGMGPSSYDDCDRCGADKHHTNECPTLWRLYEYVADEERTRILAAREEKRTLGLGKGGEGYVARDEWCYNCGGEGHLGDDCNEVAHVSDFPTEPSAFSAYNTLSGPFFDPSSSPTQPSTSRRAPRDWESGATNADGWGFDAPGNVGRRGRAKDRERMARELRAREEAQDEDEDDWFGNARNVRARGVNGDAGRKEGGKERTIKIKGAWSATAGRDRPRSHTADRGRDRDREKDRDGGRKTSSLLARLADDGDAGGRSSGHSHSRRKDDRRDRDRDRDRDYGDRRHDDRDRDRDVVREWDRERERERAKYERSSYSSRHSQESRGPRYKGGYSR